jgi:hypothetical protein
VASPLYARRSRRYALALTADNKDAAASARTALRETLRKLYHGRTPAAIRFQIAVIVIDIAILAFFIATPLLQETASFLWLDYRSRHCLPPTSQHAWPPRPTSRGNSDNRPSGSISSSC